LNGTEPDRATRVPTVAVDAVGALREAVIVDLRSPGEFADDHLPGAHNVPLFDDAQRALIGTLYKRRSPDAAFDEGRRLVREHVGPLIERIGELAGWRIAADDLVQRVERMTAGGLEQMSARLGTRALERPPERPVVLHCWRGGLRSRSVVALVRALGLDRAVGLEGGYKAWRRHVLETIAGWRAPRAFVLRGLTGVGKTLVLREVEVLRPGWTIDLEGLARHRSSLLGMVGLEPCSQRMFEGRLARRLGVLGLSPDGPVVLEGESRKVGDVVVPVSVWSALDGGTDVDLTADVEQRVRVLSEDYLATPGARAQLARQLPLVEARMKLGVPRGTLVGLLERDAIDELVCTLLEHYYDPLYRKSGERHAVAASFAVDDPRACAERVVAWIEDALLRRNV
jgi:tRNA 2-selenouridine synthase